MINPLLKLRALGQSIWLDYIERGLLVNGGLTNLIKRDGLAGITSNPAIFEKAITGHQDYDADISALSHRARAATDIYENIVLDDIARAADLLLPVHDKTNGHDGFVSIEVSPLLAYDTDRTVNEAVRLWERLHRPNVMIKVPATLQGIPAIRQLIAGGINVNVTLLFGLERYRQVRESYWSGLEDRVRTGRPLAHIASVASFFLSRIDVLIDKRIDTLTRSAPDMAEWRGLAAIAYARLAYQDYKLAHDMDRWTVLSERGAQPQRLLWASTSTKDPAYSPIKYVEALIGPETVNTLPPETLDAYRRDGRPALRLEHDLSLSIEVTERLAALDIDLERVAQQLEDEGVKKFIAPYEKVLTVLEQRRRKHAQVNA